MSLLVFALMVAIVLPIVLMFWLLKVAVLLVVLAVRLLFMGVVLIFDMLGGEQSEEDASPAESRDDRPLP
ncbi:MAG: hypothetical protein FJ000_07700 [Actinobacteria bacterium]|nr:hypothetical protein [Actinomycetota bacterium]